MEFCDKTGCESPSSRKQGRQNLCSRHYRFGQMRAAAKRNGKEVPSIETLCSLAPFQWDMKCKDCHRIMNWLAADGADSVVSLQHYRDGSFGLVCLSCNSRHASMKSDSYCDMPSEFKLCPGCNVEKPSGEFCADNGRSGALKRKSLCRTCSNAASIAWKANNKEKYNAYQRAYRARAKGESQ